MSQKDSTATIVLEEYRPNRLTYKSKADKEQLAVFSEVYYQPGWKATVDGKEVLISVRTGYCVACVFRQANIRSYSSSVRPVM